MMERDRRVDAVAALRRGVELGLTHVDTAEMYGSGRVEEIAGEALRGIRDRVFLVSKVLPSNASYDGAIQACERSLRRLGTDRLDGYLLHWPGEHPLEETFRAFEKLRADGKIRSWGVSNFDVEGMEEAVRIAGPGRIACNQVLYHLGERTIEHALVPWCEARGISVVAYSPLGQGRLPSHPSLGPRPARTALSFLLRRVPFVIPKASRLAHVEENAGAARLADAEDAAVERAFPRGPWRGLPML
jgi:diketogulonate reductase-like aldo/keto reductase